MIKTIALTGGLFFLLSLYGPAVSAQTSTAITISRNPKHVITITNMHSLNDSIMVSRVMNQYNDRVTNLQVSLVQQKVTFDSNMNSKDMLEILFKAGYQSYFISSDGKRVRINSSGTITTEDVK